MSWILWLIAIAAGAANPFQSGTNAELNKQSGAPLWTGLIVYATGFVGLLIVQAVVRHPLPDMGRLRGIPWWAWLGGLISIAPTLAGLTLAQKMGSALFTGLSITAAVATSVLIDQFGLIGFRQHPTSPGRAVGCGLMILGVWLVSRF